MTCTTPCEGHTNRQGHRCLCDTNASRAAIGLGPICFPIEREEDDVPLITPESAESAWAAAQSFLAYFAFAALALAAVNLLSKGNL